MTCRPLNSHSRYVSPVVILGGGNLGYHWKWWLYLTLVSMLEHHLCEPKGGRKRGDHGRKLFQFFYNSIWRLRSNSKILEKKRKWNKTQEQVENNDLLLSYATILWLILACSKDSVRWHWIHPWRLSWENSELSSAPWVRLWWWPHSVL